MGLIPCALLLAACGGGSSDVSASTDSAPAADSASAAATRFSKLPASLQAKVKEQFGIRCVVCHGADGKGDGPTAASLTTKPRNYTDRSWQDATSDEQIKEIIQKGGAAVGKSPLMPPQADLAQPENAELLDGIVAYIRAFGGR